MQDAAIDPAQTSLGRWALLGGVWLVYLSFGLMIAVMGPLVAPISAELGIGPARMGAILGAWPLVYIAAAIPCGLLLDRLGERTGLALAALVMSLSGLLRSLADSPEALFAAVALFGIGGPLISVGAPRLITRSFTGPARATAMGLYITGPAIGGILALSLTNSVAMPALGGDWRAVLLLYSGAVLAAGAVWLVIAWAARSAVQGPAEGGKKFNLGAFAEILRLPTVRLILIMSVGIFFLNHALNNWLPEMLRQRGLSASEAGYWAAIPTLVGIAGALVIPRLATPERRLWIMTALFAAAFLASLLLQRDPGLPLIVGLALQGIARSSMMTIAILLLMETRGVPPERLGLAGGMFFTTAEIGGVLGPFTFGLLAEWSGGFALSLAALSAVAVALLGLIALLRRLEARGG
ncbi:MAG: MFS transporter [Pseudomonadota bacterium]